MNRGRIFQSEKIKMIRPNKKGKLISIAFEFTAKNNKNEERWSINTRYSGSNVFG